MVRRASITLALTSSVAVVPARHDAAASALVAGTGAVDAVRVVSSAGARKAAGYSYGTFTTREERVKVIIHSTPTRRPSSSLEAIDANARRGLPATAVCSKANAG